MSTCQCDFRTAAPDTAPLDPRKRVRYSTGLVLGVDEFNQEQLYLMERDRLHQRALHGYGTVLGLGVAERDGADGRPEIVVAPGLAVTPRGESVCVPRAQCARLDDWLAAHADDLLGTGSPPGSPALGSPPGPLSVWLVLCPRDCETDPVPVLGDPCRTPEDLAVPSRIADDFRLELRLEAPGHQEEAGVRLLGELLRSVVVSETPGPGGFLAPEDLAERVRRIAPAGSPPALPDLADLVGPSPGSPPGSPPASPPPGSALADLALHPAEAGAALAAAWGAWIKDVRPALAGGAAGCADGGEPCVLLARLDFEVAEGAGGLQVDGPVTVNEDDRPWLLHTRVFQEWLPAGWSAAGAPPPGSPSPAPPPAPGSPPAGPALHADLLGLGADDHPQYLLVDPVTRALAADLAAAGFRLTDLGEAPAPAPGDAVRWDRAVKVGDAAGGDLAGTYPDPQVAGLQGNPLAAVVPAGPDLVLTWDGAQWLPAPVPAPPAPPPPDLLDVDLVRILNLSWSHGALAHRLQLIHDGAPARGLALAFGLAPEVEGRVRRGTLDDRTLRLWVRQPEAGTPFFRHLEVPVRVVPARVAATGAGGRITATESLADAVVPAVALLLEPAVADQLVEVRAGLTVEVRGEFILDPDGRAIDAEFTRAELPTGDRRSGATLGIQGGRFESWLTARAFVINDIDFNRASAEELTAIPGIGAVLAGRIVELRERLGGFDDPEDLRAVQGLSTNLLRRLRTGLER